MSIPKGIFDAALKSAVQNKSFTERIRLLLERFNDSDELLDVLLQGVPKKVKKVNCVTLTRFMKQKFAYSDIHEAIDVISLGAANAVVNCQCTRERYFKTQSDANAFAKDGAYWNYDGKSEKDSVHTVAGYYCYDQTFEVPYSELRENGVEFEVV